jgi:hemolysin D
VAVLKERVDMRETLHEKTVGSRAAVIDALQEYQKELTALSTDRGQLLETAAGARSLERRIAQSETDFIADQTQKLADAERRRDRILQELIKARSKNERTRLTAPIAGTVQQLAVTTLGQVVTTGQALMTIVPQNASIEIEAMILNQDIGFVEPGQDVVIKVEAFPFTRYGTVEGTVVKVSRDAVDERDTGIAADAASATRPQAIPASTGRTQNLVFPATISLKQRSMWIDKKEVTLSAGMAVTIEIKTGQRRAIDYLLSPLREVASTSGRER